MAETKTSRIHGLEAEHIKKLRHVKVVFKKNATRVVGENTHGKTTFINLVQWALGGKDSLPEEVITKGETEGLIRMPFDEFILERKFRKNDQGGEDSTVVLRRQDGSRVPKPQTVMDAFYEKYCFDPLAFMRMKPAEQLEVMRRLAGLDFGALDGRRLDLYEQRADVNKKRTDRGARLKASPTPPAGLPAEPINVDELLADQNRRFKQSQENDRTRTSRDDARKVRAERENALKDQVENVRRNREALEAAERELERRETLLKAAVDQEADAEKKAGDLVDPQLGDLTAKISAAQTTNMWVARMKDRSALEVELKKLDEESEQLSKAIELVEVEKTELTAKAKFPIEGLAYGAMPVFCGFALSEASQAEQLRVSVAIGYALSGRLKIMLVRDASVLGTAQLKLLELLCEHHDGQMLIELAARDAGDIAVLVEEGDVVVIEGDAKLVEGDRKPPQLSLINGEGGAA